MTQKVCGVLDTYKEITIFIRDMVFRITSKNKTSVGVCVVCVRARAVGGGKKLNIGCHLYVKVWYKI